MRDRLYKIRQPISVSLANKILYSLFIFLSGVSLGVISKVLDQTPSNYFPFFLEVLDLGNFFSRIGVWLFFAIIISVYSKSPFRAAINVFLFFVGMVGSYYLYTIIFAGFFPKSYMMIWIMLTIVSPFLAFICWFAKGKGQLAIGISTVIMMFMFRQAFAFGFWYFDIQYGLELLLVIAIIFVLYQSPKQIFQVIAFGMILFLLTSQIQFLNGIL